MKKFLFVLVAVLCVVTCLPITVSAATYDHSVYYMTLNDDQTATEAKIHKFFTETCGLSDAVTAGILANIFAESSYYPDTYGDYDASGNPTSYGLCQWHGSRWDALITYCDSKGYDHTTLTGQVNYLWYELYTNYPDLLSAFYTRSEDIHLFTESQVAYNCAWDFCAIFERPSDTEAKADARGELAAEDILPKFAPDLPDDELVYGSQIIELDDDGLKEVAESLKNAFDFLTDLPDWFIWLPAVFVAQLETHFALVISIVIGLISLKVWHG